MEKDKIFSAMLSLNPDPHQQATCCSSARVSLSIYIKGNIKIHFEGEMLRNALGINLIHVLRREHYPKSRIRNGEKWNKEDKEMLKNDFISRSGMRNASSSKPG